MSNSLLAVKDAIYELAKKINAPYALLPDIYSTDGKPYVDMDRSGNLYYIVKERGQTLIEKQSTDMQEILYYVFSDVTFSMAVKYELANRDRNQDFRKILFMKQEELLGILKKEWEYAKKEENENIIKISPYDDSVLHRMYLVRELIDKGIPREEAVKQAHEKYPEPRGAEARAVREARNELMRKGAEDILKAVNIPPKK